mmetsp:Transcript_14626/g.29934  ORF Transcript_14626/g.29934 Transcript_14626/m.29934 type:complete len:80 (+) Transcript_14626:191-430(+)
MTKNSRFSRKISFPATMPAFSSENPIQALYLKKKGVERLLARKSGTTYLSPKFAKETKKEDRETIHADKTHGGYRRSQR